MPRHRVGLCQGVERLEARLALSGTPGPTVWAGSQAIEPVGEEFTPIAPAPVGFDLWTPKADLVRPDSRLYLTETTVAELRANAANPAYSDIYDRLSARSAAWPNQSVFANATQPFNLAAEDPWRELAQSLQDTLVVYLAEPNVFDRFEALGTLQTWFDRLGDWFDADNVAAPGSRSAATPLEDLPLSELIATFALAHDWLKHDNNFTAAERTTIRSTLIQLTRSLEYDQLNGGEAAQWVTGYQHNHNHWNYYALGIAGAALYGESGGPLAAGDAHRWLDKAVTNYYYVLEDLPTGGSPHEGYLYLAYGDDPLFGMDHLLKTLVNVPDDYGPEAALRSLSQGVFYAMLPNGHGTTSYYHDNLYTKNFGAWSQHYLASEYGDGLAQFNGNRLTANTSDQGADWQSLFFYDPSVPEVDRSTQPLWFDDNDMGLYYARSSWDDGTDPTVFQYHAGPLAGQTSANNYPSYGLPSGHVTPEQGHVVLYEGDNPVLPSAGYTAMNSSLEYNVVVFEGREGQAGAVSLGGAIVTALDNPVGQLGGDRQFTNGDFGDGLDQARTLVTSHDPVTGTHAYLSDLGGRYRLDDARSPTGFVDPSYQRYVFYLESGAVAIVDRVRVDYPRDIYFRVPIYDSGITQIGDTYIFTTVDGVDGTVEEFSTSDGTLSTSIVPFSSNTYAVTGESGQRDVLTVTAEDATEAVFAAVIGLDTAGLGVNLTADGTGVTIDGVDYDWAEAARGDTSPVTFDEPGFFPGEDIDGAPLTLGQGVWSTSVGGGSTQPPLTVLTEPDDNAYLGAAPSAAGLSTNDTVLFQPIPQDVGVTAWKDVEVLEVTFDLQLFDNHLPGNTATAWEIEVGRDSSGLNRGLGAAVEVLADGTTEVVTGAGTIAGPALAVGDWVEVTTTLDYTTKTVDVSIGGTVVVSNAPFERDRADNFGSLQFKFVAPGAGDHRQIGFDNVRFAHQAAAAPALLSAGAPDGAEASPLVASALVAVESPPTAPAPASDGPSGDRLGSELRSRLLLLNPHLARPAIRASLSGTEEPGEPAPASPGAALNEAFASLEEDNDPDPFEDVSL